MKKALKVKPLLRYSKPQYPSFEDPNPLENPDSLPYPFSQRMLDWAMAAGILGMAACQNQSEINGKELLFNTFTFNRTGLPYQQVAFGTGQPDYLSDKISRQVALKVFREEGLTNLSENIIREIPSENGYPRYCFPISVFDEEHQIGVTILESIWWSSASESPNFDRTIVKFWNDYEFQHPRLYQILHEARWKFFREQSATNIKSWLDLNKKNSWTQDEKKLYNLFMKIAFSGYDFDTDYTKEDGWFFYKMYFKKELDSKIIYNRNAIFKALDLQSEDRLEEVLNQE
ncbi:MAG: hypothetical protein KDC92_16680, partial [Bacteroidetes bacterium]|nr:hypothetical protein [Bacteroidota bacterium]